MFMILLQHEVQPAFQQDFSGCSDMIHTLIPFFSIMCLPNNENYVLILKTDAGNVYDWPSKEIHTQFQYFIKYT